MNKILNKQDIFKSLAICSMILDHSAEYLLKYYFPTEIILFLRCLGRYAMPIFCFFAGYNHNQKSKNTLNILFWGIILELYVISNQNFRLFVLQYTQPYHLKLFLYYVFISILILTLIIFIYNHISKNFKIILTKNIIIPFLVIICAYFISKLKHGSNNILISIYLGKICINFLKKYLDDDFVILIVYILLITLCSFSYKTLDYGSLSPLFVITGGLSKLNKRKFTLHSSICIILLFLMNQLGFLNKKQIILSITNILIHLAAWISINRVNHIETISNKLFFIKYLSRNALAIYVIHLLILHGLNLAIKIHLL
ncbi:MAG: hypothetical protein ISN64_00525 [Rickettsia sp.]|nr:hypothetical protein [Rickettsia sp.]